MTEIEQKALALMNDVRDERGYVFKRSSIDRKCVKEEALCRAIEQHEAFRQEVSDAVAEYKADQPHIWQQSASGYFAQFIIPKPKPDLLAQVLGSFDGTLWEPEDVSRFHAALDALGFEIREKNDD